MEKETKIGLAVVVGVAAVFIIYKMAANKNSAAVNNNMQPSHPVIASLPTVDNNSDHVFTPHDNTSVGSAFGFWTALPASAFKDAQFNSRLFGGVGAQQQASADEKFNSRLQGGVTAGQQATADAQFKSRL